MLNKSIEFFLKNRLITILILLSIIFTGISTSPFNSKDRFLPGSPVAVDAIPDIGENQQIVFTEWRGRSPQDIEDQLTYPLTSFLLGIPGVKTIRSSSVFGFSVIYIIFKDDIDFYWSRSRILEKLNSLPPNLLPSEVNPSLGPDATGLGQVFWYTLEGRDSKGNPTGGWDLQELRTIQDYYIKYGLASAEGVSEVASIGGYVKEYQIDVNPTFMKANGIGLDDVIRAVKQSNQDVGAKTIEINEVEYLVRGLGYIKSLSDIEETVIKSNNNTPIRIKDVAKVTLGPETRRGMLDKSGAEAVGGVITARYKSNPLKVITNIKDKIELISSGLPSKTLEDGTISKVTIIPFYDRTKLINETLGTLEEALNLEILITILVIIVMIMNLRASLLISSILPLAVLAVFIVMRYTGIEANIVALSGIAIAIGTMVDIGIVLLENIIKRIEQKKEGENILNLVYNGTAEVSSAILTAVSTTVISFVPVFAMEASEGKLFRPLAFTKTYALIASLFVAFWILPTLAYFAFSIKIRLKNIRIALNILLCLVGVLGIFQSISLGYLLISFGILNLLKEFSTISKHKLTSISLMLVCIFALYFLTSYWLPVGADRNFFLNLSFVVFIVGFLLGSFYLLTKYYEVILNWCLENKAKFLSLPCVIVFFGLLIWFGFNSIFGFIPNSFEKLGFNLRANVVWSYFDHKFKGIGKEFMPSLDEGSFLLMPTSMPHSGFEANKDILQKLDMAVTAIPEIETVVGKIGRVESALDSAPISMYENIINYKSEYKLDEHGNKLRYAVDEDENFKRDEKGELILDKDGEYFRQWRDHIKSPDDIWKEIVRASRLPGVTSAPKLQPIETRLVMLQTGMRAPMGIKVQGPNLNVIEKFGLELEKILKTVPSVKKEAVFADRIVGKPYLHLEINRKEIAKYGLSVAEVQKYIEVAIGGIKLSSTVEGRERYPIRVRYPRELRDNPKNIRNILIPTKSNIQIPLGDLISIKYVRGPQVIKSEDTFLIGYVLFDKKDDFSEVSVVEAAQKRILQEIEQGNLKVPPGITYQFTGTYENQIRAEKRLSILIPIVLILIFLILYLQFKSVNTTLMVFSSITVAFAGGFIMLWLYAQSWFLNFSFFDINMRDIFQVQTVNLSVAVWVGFIALFGIATDDGVVIASYLKQEFEKEKNIQSVKEIRDLVKKAGLKRIRPCLMTTATTILALLPILTSKGRGSDVMFPMALPSIGGMAIEIVTLFVIPVLYSIWQERKFSKGKEIKYED